MQAGEDEQLERDYRRMVNGRKIAETLNLVHGLTGEEEGNGAGELTGVRFGSCHRRYPVMTDSDSWYSCWRMWTDC